MMSTTTDWLAELREAKQQAIAPAHAEGAEREVLLLTAEERLQSEQSTLAALIGYMQIETLLQEFCAEILHDHPNFFGYSLDRTVRSRSMMSEAECTEPDPWTGPVVNYPLPRNLDLGNGRYVTAVDWKIQSNYHGAQGHEHGHLRLCVSASTAGVKLGGQLLTPTTTEIFKQALLDTFKAALHTFSCRRSHRHHRPWYRRVLRTLFPRSRLSVTLVAGSTTVIALSIVLAIHAAQNIGLMP